jgi:hypothetical protein
LGWLSGGIACQTKENGTGEDGAKQDVALFHKIFALMWHQEFAEEQEEYLHFLM